MSSRLLIVLAAIGVLLQTGASRADAGPVEVTVEGKARWPLRIERHADGTVDVTLADEKPREGS